MDTQTLEVLITIDVPGTLGGWNKDGSQVYTLSANSTAIAIFDTSTGKLAQTVFDGDAILRGIEWSPDNTKFATSFNLKDLSLIEVDTGSVTSYNQNGSLGPIAWSPDSTKIASAVMLEVKKGTLGSIESASGAVIFELYVWDVSTGQIMSYITPLSEYPQILRWSPNGVEVAGGAANGGIYIWDTLKNELVDYFLSNGSILSMDYSPFGSRLAIGSNSYQLQYISPDRRVEPKNLPYVQSVPNIGLEVFVPIATVERFAEIAASCNAPASLTQVDSALQTDAAQTLLTQLDAVPEGAIPVGCEADLRAIAEAIQQSQ